MHYVKALEFLSSESYINTIIQIYEITKKKIKFSINSIF